MSENWLRAYELEIQSGGEGFKIGTKESTPHALKD